MVRWRNVDLVPQRCAKTIGINLDQASLDHLNDYFGRLCHDDSYVGPTDVLIEGGCGSSRDNGEAGLECAH